MIQGRQNPALGLKAAQDGIRIHSPLDDFDRDIFLGTNSAGAVDGAHAALPDPLDKLIVAQPPAEEHVGGFWS
jgi:hypothetical protein